MISTDSVRFRVHARTDRLSNKGRLTRSQRAEEDIVAQTVAQMTKDELSQMIQAVVEAAVEQKLLELLGDPDDGLELQQALRERLLRQQQAVAAGHRGEALDDVARQLGLE